MRGRAEAAEGVLAATNVSLADLEGCWAADVRLHEPSRRIQDYWQVEVSGFYQNGRFSCFVDMPWTAVDALFGLGQRTEGTKVRLLCLGGGNKVGDSGGGEGDS